MSSKELYVGCLVDVFLHHHGEEGWLGPLGVVDPPPVGHQTVSGHHQQEVLHDPTNRRRHLVMEQRLDDPVGVPIIELSETTWKISCLLTAKATLFSPAIT